jgi:regulator of nucleoside diphosphate kinase
MTGMILGLRQPDMTETPKNRMIMEKILSKNTHTGSLAGRKHPRITLTAEDNDRLSSLVRAAMDKMPDIASYLADELDRASVLPKGRVAADTVRMGSHLEYRDETLGTVRTATLVYPDEADISQGKISVLTPIGIALIGLKVGQSITWETRNGVVKELTLLEVRQPQYA